MSKDSAETKRQRPVPTFVPSTNFYKALGIYFEFGTKLVQLGVLRPDGRLNGKPIFGADLETLNRARSAVASYRVRVAQAGHNLAPSHV